MKVSHVKSMDKIRNVQQLYIWNFGSRDDENILWRFCPYRYEINKFNSKDRDDFCFQNFCILLTRNGKGNVVRLLSQSCTIMTFSSPRKPAMRVTSRARTLVRLVPYYLYTLPDVRVDLSKGKRLRLINRIVKHWGNCEILDYNYYIKKLPM